MKKSERHVRITEIKHLLNNVGEQTKDEMSTLEKELTVLQDKEAQDAAPYLRPTNTKKPEKVGNVRI